MGKEQEGQPNMMIAGHSIAGRIVGVVVGGLFLFLLIAFGLYQCDKRRDEAAQSRVERGQAGAASESARDAIGTVTQRGAEERASEELTRTNDKEIRNAEGAKERVGSGVDLAGRRSLCRRAAYRDDPKCRMFKPAPR
jgi:flagellar biosynthesis/type III secretory pathway M-ring protein FliF/YscJ